MPARECLHGSSRLPRRLRTHGVHRHLTAGRPAAGIGGGPADEPRAPPRHHHGHRIISRTVPRRRDRGDGAMNDEKTLPVTEMRNPRSMDLDLLSSEQMLQVINAEDRTVADAVAAEAGSAAELEDDPALGADLMAQRSVGSRDIVVGLAASGTTPFTLGALREAHRRGAMTVAITCVPGSPLAQTAGIAITPLVGPEVLTGSTRMKAGTAQKLVCNMLTTATMVRLGKVYSNLMVEVQPRNAKLAVRAVWMIAQAVDCSPEDARAWLGRAGGDVKTAIVMARTGVSRERAQALLVQTDGAVRVP